ncbi:hypothetical protein HON36_00605 [Candidatus Parcubacteria bacterium]|jgi:hypothetical protein|nr:hypothetical protein [Candidatus Komeilibacteria bacterium]MBT4447314.1 hypothetical protein [Candidatus Komeilibacteria bacterium]MBT4849337.1 hypothetical protein [Candidatus Parcubacteria bacterium]
MKNIILTVLLFIIFPLISFAWDDCVHGEINDPYPGNCARYIDTDNDAICDHSQPALVDRKDDIKVVTAIEIEQDFDNKVDKKQISGIYHLIPIALPLFVLYILSHILSKKRIISVINHRKFWNLLLLISFVISGGLGILLIININFNLNIPLPFDMLFWHVEIGIVMFAITICHISWHLSYFKNILKYK